MNWRAVAVVATLIPIVVIVLQFDVRLEDVLAIGAVPFVLSVLLMLGKLALQGVKLAYIAISYLGRFDSAMRLAGVRVGSEFIKFSTPMFIGAEFIVIYYLHKKKVHPSKSAWVALVDIVTEVLAAGILSVIAGILAILSGIYIVGVVVLAISILITGVWTVLFFMSAKREFHMPRPMRALAVKVAGERGIRYMDEGDKWLAGICKTSRENASSSKSRRIFVVSLGISLVSWILYGLSFWVIAGGVGYVLDAFDSVMAVMASNALANLPITVGGAGLAEFGIFSYLNNANPFALDLPAGAVEWDAIIGWRIATYYIPIAITWLLLVRLALVRIDRSSMEKSA